MNPTSSHRGLIKSKIQDLQQAAQTVARWRAEGQRVVFTNGVFDLVHLGHLSYLADAADLGDRLIVAVNSDSSVQVLKGPDRPIFDELTRAFKLASLQAVDLVVVFSEQTPIACIETLSPDVLVKGGDYDPDQIVGSAFVRKSGGRVLTIPLVQGKSSSNVIEKIKTGSSEDI